MRSPFPGMDPYLEARWSDIHSTLITLVKEAIQPLLPHALRARSEERVLLETVEGEALAAYRGDVSVVDTGGGRRRGASGRTAAAATIEPVGVHVYEETRVDRWIQVIDTTSGNRVVTAIEVLSPGNKGPGRLNKDYNRKLRDYARAGVNVLEIDLLREPKRRRLPIGQIDLPAGRRTPYLACIRRAVDPSMWWAYPISIREPIPLIPVPLRESDPDIMLDLQKLLERAYVAGGHDDIDYSQPPSPPLKGKDAAWADDLLRRAGLREKT